MSEVLFWCSLATIGYVYAGYPLLLYVWSRWRPIEEVVDPVVWPSISIVLVARNEAPRLPARLENLLTCDYPADRRQVIVVSDGSSDETPDVLSAYRDRIDVLLLPPVGKAEALNRGVALARCEVLVFADARQAFAPDAIRALVRPLSDPAVGAVTGELLLDAERPDRRRTDRRVRPRTTARDRRTRGASAATDGMGLYWRYEKALRRMESAVGSTLGTTGAIYAMRRPLWEPLPPDTLLDDVLAPMRVVLRGYRVVFHDQAKAFDEVSASADIESRRKIRTLAGNVQILWLEPRLLMPGINPVWWQYVSHKVGRLVVPYALLALFASSVALAPQHPIYLAVLLSQSAFYLLAAYGAYLEYRRGIPGPTQAVDASASSWRPSSSPFDERRV